MATKDWSNVYAVRQEYNKFQKKWFPIILVWSKNDRTAWIEALCTEAGSSFYYTEIKDDYTKVTRKGTDKCDPEDVKRIRDFFEHDYTSEEMHEVQKLGDYRP